MQINFFYVLVIFLDLANGDWLFSNIFFKCNLFEILINHVTNERRTYEYLPNGKQ